MKNEINQLEKIKQEIGFKTAFTAVLGFYAAQFVVTVLGLLTIGVVGTLLYFLSKAFL